jgi:glycosyltransferase involved in cell wall biosynthesis
LAQSLNLIDKVHFVGYRSDRARFLKAMDLFVLTSQSEGMPLAVLEAWAARVPVVASRVGGLKKLIRHGDNGLLFKFEDLSDLQAAIARAIGNPQLRDRIAVGGFTDVHSKFTLFAMLTKYRALYREISCN